MHFFKKISESKSFDLHKGVKVKVLTTSNDESMTAIQLEIEPGSLMPTHKHFEEQFGFIKEGIASEINNELIQKFRMKTSLFQSSLPPEGAILYAYLSKTFEFRLNFENINEPLKFKTANGNQSSIESFGLTKNTSNDSKIIYQRKLKKLMYVIMMKNMDLS